MAIHGDIWLPLDPNTPSGPMLYCEAFSDGYLAGVGYGVLCSSSRIAEVCALSALLAGSPVFHLPGRDIFVPMHSGSVAESFADKDYEGDDPDDLEAMVSEAIQSMALGDVKGALSGRLSEMTLSEKLARGYGIDACVKTFDAAWASFLAEHESSGSWPPQEAAERLASLPNTQDLFTGCGYFWRDGQFWGFCHIDDESDDKSQWRALPLIQLAAINRRSSCDGDFPGYLARITPVDRHALLLLLRELERAGRPTSGLFDGSCDAQVQSMREASELESHLPAGKSTPRSSAL